MKEQLEQMIADANSISQACPNNGIKKYHKGYCNALVECLKMFEAYKKVTVTEIFKIIDERQKVDNTT